MKVVASTEVTISNSTFTNNHNSIAICVHYICRVDGLEEVGDESDTGRTPAYISPNEGATTTSAVTLSGNRFHNSDTRSFDGPGSIGNHLVIGYLRAAKTNNEVGAAAGAFTYGAGNSFTGSGVFGGAVVDDFSAISLESESARSARRHERRLQPDHRPSGPHRSERLLQRQRGKAPSPARCGTTRRLSTAPSSRSPRAPPAPC